MSPFLLAQIIGIVSIIIAIVIFQVNDRSRMLKLSMLASVFNMVQMLLLGAYTGAAMFAIGGVRAYTFHKTGNSKNRIFVLFAFLLLSTVVAILTWQDASSILALGGTLCAGFALWHQKPRSIRRWALLAPPLWFGYAAIHGAIPIMVLEVILLTSNLVGEYRYDFKHIAHAKRRFARAA